MADLLEQDDAGGNAPVVTVSELSGAIRRALEQGFGHVRVRGEVGRVSRPASGHVYLDLKDERAVLAAVIWRATAAGLTTPPEQGMEVIATGRITTFAGQSRYQLIIEHLEPAGLGALMALLEKRRKMLAAEGLFDPARKKRLPFLPRVIGVVTSPTGAVIRDILHRLADRFPRRWWSGRSRCRANVPRRGRRRHSRLQRPAGRRADPAPRRAHRRPRAGDRSRTCGASTSPMSCARRPKARSR
ncbi:MAG: hypothetical protein KatS3mg118_1526 [Paracoccaceae bacterium]|nr:MAG: hypothetical protein KatS3mg118_1526 [Paracoccaceae bacterium]